MSDFLSDRLPIHTPSVELLGYSCASADEQAVSELLAGLTDEEHTLHCEWVTYGIEGVMVDADDLVTRFTDRRTAETVTDVEQESVAADLDSRIAWLQLLDGSERVALLTYAEPSDGIGEGDVSNLTWDIAQGGANDYAFHKMLQAGIAGLGHWKKWVLGEARLRPQLEGVLGRMDGALYRNSPEELERKAREVAQAALEILGLLAPGLKHVKELTDSMGIDWDELLASER